MKIDFGVVSKYFPDKGFGFVSQTFSAGSQSEVFFHIKSLKRFRADIVEKLNNGQPAEGIYFWYETETTLKGEQVRAALNSESVGKVAAHDISDLSGKIESKWRNVSSMLPAWLPNVTVELLGADRMDKLKSERRELEIEKQRQREIAQEAVRTQIEERKRQEAADEGEFQQLVAEMSPLAFIHSGQVSRYIVQQRLGYKYKNISGVVTMEENGTSWDFKGGFPPKIYARLCDELGLRNNESGARPVGFKSFKDLIG